MEKSQRNRKPIRAFAVGAKAHPMLKTSRKRFPTCSTCGELLVSTNNPFKTHTLAYPFAAIHLGQRCENERSNCK